MRPEEAARVVFAAATLGSLVAAVYVEILSLQATMRQ
jgi:hypothetical protein